MIHFIDQTSERDHHMVFNSSILKILLKMYPSEKITSHGSASNHKSIKELLSDNERKSITFDPIFYTKSKSEGKLLKGLNYIVKENRRRLMFKEVLSNASENDLVFVSVTTFSSLYVFKRLKAKFLVPTILVLHGDLDFVYNSNSKLEKLIGATYKKVFNTFAPNFYYLLLNKISKEYLMQDGFLKREEILEINHPHNMLNVDVTEKEIAENGVFSFGHIGSMEVERKNSHYIYQLAEKFSAEITENKVSFQVIGLITSSIIPYKNKWVSEMAGNAKEDKPDYLSREDYESKLQKLDYSLFFYDTNQYIFRTSGAIIDAIAACIPFVVLKHPIFDYIFQEAGDVGFQCKDLDEMHDLIKKIISRDEEIMQQYKAQVLNLMKIRQRLSVQEVAIDLKNQLDAIALYSFKQPIVINPDII